MSIASRITSIEGHISDIYDSVELTGVDTTDIDKNLVNVPNTLKEGYIDIINNGTDTLYNNFPKVSGEGTSLTLNNTYQAPMRNNLKGNTSQTGTPTPTSPIPVNVVSGDNSIVVCGKNLINNSLYRSYTNNGVTFTPNSDGSITISGTVTSTVCDGIMMGNWSDNTKYINLDTTSTYTMGMVGNTNNKITMFLVHGTSVINYTRTSNTFTPNYDSVGLLMIRYIGAVGDVINTTVYPMLVKGSTTLSTYEPYQGNTYNIDLPVENKLPNLATSFDTTSNGVTKKGEYGTYRVYGTATGPFYGVNNALVNNYTIKSGDYLHLCNNSVVSYMAIVFYTTNSNFDYAPNAINRVIDLSSHIGETITGVGFYTSASFNGDVTFTPMILQTNKQNSYTPYGTTPIELCKIGNYQDYFGKSDGRNLFDKDNANKLDCLLNGQNGSIANYSGAKLMYIPCEPSTTYTISKIKSARFVVGTSSSTPSNGVSCSVYQANNDATSITITSGTSDKFLCVFYYLSSADTLTEQQILNSIMINKGSSATPWQPYGVGKWYLHKEIGKVASYNGETITTSYISTTGGLDTGATVYYGLSTPTTTEITYQPLIDQLEQFYQAQSKNNQTNISQINNDLGFIISASALKKG